MLRPQDPRGNNPTDGIPKGSSFGKPNDKIAVGYYGLREQANADAFDCNSGQTILQCMKVSECKQNKYSVSKHNYTNCKRGHHLF